MAKIFKTKDCIISLVAQKLSLSHSVYFYIIGLGFEYLNKIDQQNKQHKEEALKMEIEPTQSMQQQPIPKQQKTPAEILILGIKTSLLDQGYSDSEENVSKVWKLLCTNKQLQSVVTYAIYDLIDNQLIAPIELKTGVVIKVIKLPTSDSDAEVAVCSTQEIPADTYSEWDAHENVICPNPRCKLEGQFCHTDPITNQFKHYCPKCHLTWLVRDRKREDV